MSNDQISKLKLDPSADGVEYDMKKRVETKEDGRKLIYYNFVRKAADGCTASHAAAQPDHKPAKKTEESAKSQANKNALRESSKNKHQNGGDLR